MKRMQLVLMLMPILLWAQNYYLTASGQTTPFTLTAGATAGMDYTSVEKKTQAEHANKAYMAIYPNPCNRIPHISVKNATGPSTVSIYNITGKKLQTINFNRHWDAALDDQLPNGIFFARLHTNGRLMQTTHFLIVR